MKEIVKKLIRNEKFVLGVYSVVALIIAIQKYVVNDYNNFKIFRLSFFHLIHKQNLYIEHPSEYFDLFLYNPSFAVMFAPFAVVPPLVGACLWNLFSVLLTFFTIKALPFSHDKKVFVWWFLLIEITTAIHSYQTNTVIMCCIVLTYVFLERDKPFIAALFPLVAFYIKGYGLIGAALFVFYPVKFKYIASSLFWLIILGALPLIFVTPAEFIGLYEGWFKSLQDDHKINLGVSIMGIMNNFINMSDKVIYVQLFGVLILGITLLRDLFLKFEETIKIRLFILAYLLLWVLLFNHNAESSTYIISVAGVALWYAYEKKSNYTLFLIWFVFIITILGPTDLYPKSFSDKFIIKSAWKAFPCFLVWLLIQYKLLFPQQELQSSLNE